eukprot:TRINITY_DN66749_c2_g1_i7.p1 TRINITY_DN66749_c2_g1~~TRINITY_DN66749_c2_g1_i7.p1  ORF type:complete len:103 (-),score=10.14 TRINITY_DN66749_c2_g1_i7:293-601(-)
MQVNAQLQPGHRAELVLGLFTCVGTFTHCELTTHTLMECPPHGLCGQPHMVDNSQGKTNMGPAYTCVWTWLPGVEINTSSSAVWPACACLFGCSFALACPVA